MKVFSERFLHVVCVSLFVSAFSFLGCGTAPCRSQTKGVAGMDIPRTKETDMKAAATERVKVYKPDGTLQCGQGKFIAISEMQKELKGIVVFGSVNRNDGMMRIQMCGQPTGQCNVFEIDHKDLDKALALGFKQWAVD